MGERPMGDRPMGERPMGQRPPRPQEGPRRPDGYEGAPARRPLREGEGPAPVRGKQAAPGGRMAYEEDSERYAPARREMDGNGRRKPPASVRRPPYDFEEDGEEDIPRRRRGCLTPIVILLLVVGVALAGICLPNWGSADAGGITGTLAGLKNTLTGAFGQVKGMVFPEDIRITGFTVTPTDGTAPTELVFSVQTSNAVTDLRFLDKDGAVLFEKAFTEEDTLNGVGAENRIAKNSKGLLWSLKYTMEQAYTGPLTVQTKLKDGTWDEGVLLASTLHIAAPVAALPPISSFDCDTTEGAVPAAIHFTVQTSPDVVAIRVVDSYETAVATYSLSDGASETGKVEESSESLAWDLTAEVDAAYEGNYTLQYQTASDIGFAPSDYGVHVEFSEPLAETSAKAGMEAEGEEGTEEEAGGEETGEEETADAGGEDLAVAANAGADAEPPQEQVAKETPKPEAPAATPAPKPLPALAAAADASAQPSEIGLKKTIYNETKTAESFSRTLPISLLNPYSYAVWEGGIFTFRGGPFRQNAAFGTVDVQDQTLAQVWKAPVGSKKLSKATVYGVGWPGQPAIIKWYTEARGLMNLNDEKRNVLALKEVILGGQDGLLYFLDLSDGKPTREPIDMGAPSGGGVSVATNGTPLVGVGQSHSNLATKQVPNGYHLYNLINSKELYLLEGKDKAASSNYSGASGAALFEHKYVNEKKYLSMVLGGQNGVLYTMELNENFDNEAGALSMKPAIQRYKTLASKQDKKETIIHASVAMYSNYIYYVDDTGVLQCVDANTLTTVWAIKTGDSVKATPALDFEGDSQTLALYTANTLLHQGKKGVCTIRRIDGLTGKQDWEYVVPDLAYTTEFEIGCIASPVVGQNALEDLVIFTASNGEKGGVVIALEKADGTVAWTTPLTTGSQSSPVAVYNDQGEAWIVQAESDGNVHLLEGKTGKIVNTLKLEGEIVASPAVYKNMMVIGTTGKDTGAIYGIEIK